MFKRSIVVAFCLVLPVLAQAPPQRWDAETVKHMLREIEVARDKAVQDRAALPPPTLATPAAPSVVGPTVARPAVDGPLLNLSAAAVIAKVGAPTFQRRDGKMHLLQFTKPACVLDVFLYSDVSRYIETRSRNGAVMMTDTCVRKFFALRGIISPTPPALPAAAHAADAALAPVPALPVPAVAAAPRLPLPAPAMQDQPAATLPPQ
jgi:hypothetical protein